MIKIVCNSSDTNSNNNVEIKFKRYWSRILYPCQKLNYYGVPVNVVPSFQGRVEHKKISEYG